MARTVAARQGDTLDSLIWREAALGAAALPQVMAVNPGLADLGPLLPHGRAVIIPDVVEKSNTLKLVQLWD